jgi:anthranilate phosphoribosyltransferase
MSGFKESFLKVQSGKPLSEAEMEGAVSYIIGGEAAPGEIAFFLTALSQRGETVDEIVGAAKVLRRNAETVKAPDGAVDCCGTGGDGQHTWNVSTAVALVAASCGVPMAKHGNRASSAKTGAADVMEALGVRFDLTTEQLEEALVRFNFAFLMAPRHHQAMKNVAAVRQALGFRTIFNLIGPLANPAGTKRQLVGVFDIKWVRPLAEALQRLGAEKAMVVHGAGGLDEITVTGPTRAARLERDKIAEKDLLPSDFGLKTHKLADLTGGYAEANAAALMDVLKGKPGAYRDIVLANAAAVLMLHGSVASLPLGARLAADCIDRGETLQLLDSYRQFTQKAAKKT